MEFGIFHKIMDTSIEVIFWVLFWYAAIWNWMDSFMSMFSLCAD